MKMKFRTLALVATAAVALAAAIGAQQKEKERASPHETVSSTVDGAKISIEYGRPYLKGRQVGVQLAPFGQVWRTGADEATTLVTDKALSFGTLTVPPGKYTLYTLPGQAEWQLIVNKQTGQWGTVYQEGQDLGRVKATPGKTATPVEQLILAVDDTPTGGALRLEWADVKVVFPFSIAN